MFDKFENKFKKDTWGSGLSAPDYNIKDPDLKELLNRFGGCSFNGGLYRIIHPQEMEQWNDRVNASFPTFHGLFSCFGYTWDGDAFALYDREEMNGKPSVLLFEISSGRALGIPDNLETFHNTTLVNDPDPPLNVEFYEYWKESGGKPPKYDECVGFRIPLFLGGSDDYENMEISDIDVYWSITGQIMNASS